LIDVQIVSGRDPAYISEAIGRVEEQDVDFNLYVALNHELPFEHGDAEVVRNGLPLSFEENHNRLAARGSSPYILFLDDDAFLFPGALERMVRLMEDRRVAAVGALNNQTMPMAVHGRRLPGFASLEEFRAVEADAAKVASIVGERFEGQSAERVFLPGNCLLVRRKVWQREHGGWDEGFRNWNEEVDFLLWCRERGYGTVCATDVWFFHCQGRSRSAEGLLANMVDGARHFNAKWPRERLNRLAVNEPGLRSEINELFNLNQSNADEAKVRASAYYQGAIRR